MGGALVHRLVWLGNGPRLHVPLKCLEPLDQWCSIISKKTWVLFKFQLQPVHLHDRIHERSWCMLFMCELCIKHHSWHRLFLSANIYRTKNLLYMSECEVPGYWLCTHSTCDAAFLTPVGALLERSATTLSFRFHPMLIYHLSLKISQWITIWNFWQTFRGTLNIHFCMVCSW